MTATPLQHLQLAFLAFRNQRLRSALAVLGVTVGVFAVCMLMAVSEGAQVYLERSLLAMGPNCIDILPGHSNTRVFGFPQGSRHPLTLRDVHALAQQATLLRGVSPIVLSGGAVRSRYGRRDTSVIGVGPDFRELRSLQVTRGRFLRAEELDAHRRVVVLGYGVNREIFGGGDAIGHGLQVMGQRFRVIGVLGPRGRTLGIDMDDQVLIPATSAMDLLGVDRLSQILTASRTRVDAPAAVKEIVRILVRMRSGEQTFTTFSDDDLLHLFESLTTMMQWLFIAIASISLLVGSLGIMNIMFVTVHERTREIGIRRAVGATQTDILWQFLIESVVVSVLGGALGLATMMLAVPTLRLLAPQVPLQMSWYFAAIALCSSLIVGALSGVMPARRAARIAPVDALRWE